ESMEQDVGLGRSPIANSLRFHSAVVNASGNNVLADVYRYLNSLLNFSRTRTLFDLQHRPEALSFHKRIYGRILVHDGEGAGAEMREHLQNELTMLNEPEHQDRPDGPEACGAAGDSALPQF
ncbi:MAG TPA: FCD domain-containing protein, partial [Oscillospiraceae bacterium]|nr:FCD domain-containing protein [Oscillospiraceae bacterium]